MAASLAQLIGVTRIARLTGLDRTGLEVASAIRPGGHVLQVSNGKGRDWASAARGALSEAAELWAAEQPVPEAIIAPSAEAPIEVRRVPAQRLDRREQIYVPLYEVCCPPIGAGPI